MQISKLSWCCQFTTALLVCNLVLVVSSSRVIHLPLRKYKQWVVNDSKMYKDGIERTKRAASSDGDLKVMMNNLKGESAEGYYINIGVGTPPQQMQVLIDTGSANFAIACENSNNLTTFFQRQNSSTYEETGTQVYVPYTEGWWNGILGADQVGLISAESLSSKVNIACITESDKFFPLNPSWQGILGLGYEQLSRPDPSTTPFWDSVLASHPNLSDVFSVQLCGSSFVHSHEKPLKQGSLILGGVIPSLATSPFLYTPIYKEWYYEVVLTDIEVERESLEMDCKEYNMDKTIVDTGTTSIRLPIKVFEAVKDQILFHLQLYPDLMLPKNEFFDGVDLMCYYDMALPFKAFPVISFYLMISDNTAFRLDLTPQHYLRPVSDYSDAEVNHTCVKYGFLTSNTGTVLGAIFMEAFYVVFDRANKRIGFAQTSCPLPDPDHKILDKTVDGPFTYTKNFSRCAFKKSDSGGQNYLMVTYILLAFSIVLFVPFILFITCRLRHCLRRRREGWQHQDDEKQNVLTMSDGL